MGFLQIDCFKINMLFWKYLAVWPDQNASRLYHYHSKIFILTVVILYDALFTINFYFLPRHLDIFIEDMLFYFTELATMSKVLTVVFMRSKIHKLLDTLESDIFQPDTDVGQDIIKKAKKHVNTFWKIVAVPSIISHYVHVISPLILHVFLSAELELPICNYHFLSEHLKEKYIYPLYFYQTIGMDCHMLYNVNIDTFILGLMILTIAQLDILDIKLRRVTDQTDAGERLRDEVDIHLEVVKKLNDCIKHFDEISKFCKNIQDVFSPSLLVQFSMSSSIICVCLFRFTMTAPIQYYIFLVSYMFIMVIQILIPCYYGTQIIVKSNRLSLAAYDCDWTPRSRHFKSSLRLLIERTNKPLSITGGKMFLLSLSTFTSIMNSAYSFFTLLQQMQTRE